MDPPSDAAVIVRSLDKPEEFADAPCTSVTITDPALPRPSTVGAQPHTISHVGRVHDAISSGRIARGSATMLPGWERGASVLWRSRSEPRSVGYVFSANLVEHTHHTIVVFQPAGSPGKRRTGRRGGPRDRTMLPGGWDGRHEDVVWPGPDMIRLHPVGSAYSILRRWNGVAGRYEGWYVNFEQPWKQTPIGFDSRDDILDIVVADDFASWRFKDRDELDWSVEVGKISAAEAAATIRVAEAVATRIEARAWPFVDEAWTPFAPDSKWSTPTLPASWAVPYW